jgi:hypothetical protein
MPKPRTLWQPGEHEPIQKLSENLWWVRGPIPGISIRRCMTLARLADGRVLIWSAMPLDEPSMQAVEAWGTPAFLIVPSALHRLDAAAYKARYPALRVLCPRGAQRAAGEVVPVEGLLEEFPSDAHVSFRPLAGIKDKEGAMLVRSQEGITVVLNDALFNMPVPRDFPARIIVKMLGSAPGPRISRVLKLLWLSDKAAFRQSLQQLSEISDLTRVIVAHDSPISGPAAREALQSAVEQLA